MSVLFINTFYYPDEEERRRLDLLQDKLYFSLVELKFQTKDMSKYQQVMTKERYHNGFRSRLKLIKNDVDLSEQCG